MSTTEEVFQANQSYASGFDKGGLPSPPARKLAVVTCMDARLHPETFLNLSVGDAHMIRNAGGSAQDALRSLVVSEQLLGTEEVLIIKHTKCGMVSTNDAIRQKVQQQTGVDVSDMDFLPFAELEQAVRDDVAFLRNSPLIPDNILITGAVYDVETGALKRIE